MCVFAHSLQTNAIAVGGRPERERERPPHPNSQHHQVDVMMMMNGSHRRKKQALIFSPLMSSSARPIRPRKIKGSLKGGGGGGKERESERESEREFKNVSSCFGCCVFP